MGGNSFLYPTTGSAVECKTIKYKYVSEIQALHLGLTGKYLGSDENPIGSETAQGPGKTPWGDTEPIESLSSTGTQGPVNKDS